MHLAIPLFAAALALLAGCHDGCSTNRITVKNRTDAAITVHDRTEVEHRLGYDRDGDGNDDIAVIAEARCTVVPAHDETDLIVQDEWWSSRVEVRTATGFSREYRVEVDGVGRGTLWVRPEHFPAEPIVPTGAG